MSDFRRADIRYRSRDHFENIRLENCVLFTKDLPIIFIDHYSEVEKSPSH